MKKDKISGIVHDRSSRKPMSQIHYISYQMGVHVVLLISLYAGITVIFVGKRSVVEMAQEKSFYMTAEGKVKLQEELEHLKNERRKEVVERIKEARGFGDLSENSEYDAAKDEQAFVEARIQTVENMIRHAVIIENDNDNPDMVSMGKSVTFQELPDGDEETYTIVGSAEADPFEGKISNDSPMAQSLIGHEVGDKVTVVTPGGELDVKIVSVTTK